MNNTVKKTIPFTRKFETENCVGLLNERSDVMQVDWIVLQVRENGKPIEPHKVVTRSTWTPFSGHSPIDRIQEVMDTREKVLANEEKFFANDLRQMANFAAREQQFENEGII